MKLFQKILNKNKLYITIFSILILITIPLIFRVFTPRDELKYVLISENILKSGNPFVFFVNGELYTDKPPLYFYIIILSKFIFGGYYTYGIVLFNIIIETIFIAKIYKFLYKRINKNVALISVYMITASILQYFSLILVRMDIFLSTFITLALINFYECYEKNNYKNIYKFYIFTGFAFLFKGLVGILTPLFVILFFKFFASKKYTMKNIKIFQGILIIILFILFWILPAYLTFGNKFIQDLLFKQVYSRTITAFVHKHSFYYYLEIFPAIFFPWSVATIYTIFNYFKIIYQKKTISDLEKFLILWVLITVLYLSFAKSKLVIYLLPVIPAMLILTAITLSKAEKKIKSRITMITILIFSIIPISLIFIKSKDFIPFKMYAIICISVVALISDILFIFNHKKLSYLILGLLFPVTALIIGIKINYINEKIGYKEHEKKMKYKIPKEITDKLYKK